MQHERRVAGRRRDDPRPTSPTTMTIEQLAEASGLSVRNIRAYQQRGLRPPVERAGRRATFTQEHLARLRLVRALHDHGLSLRAIGDLVERGTADAELAEVSRQTLTSAWRRPVHAPLNPQNVALFEATRAGALVELERAGLISHQDGRPHANAAGLGLIAALSARGVDLDVSTDLVLLGAYAAKETAPALAGLVAALEGEPDERAQLMVQLVATAFADVLVAELTTDGSVVAPAARDAARV
jgi:DNA-binding transcriptional MerR regulator